MLNDLRDTFGYRIPEIFPGGKTPQGNAVIAAMPTTPNADRQKLIQALVKGLLDDGIWAMLDIFYLAAAHASDSSLLNWINPGTHDLTVVNLVAGQFAIDRGWTGNGVNGYLNTNYNPSTDGINYTLNSVSLGIYIRTNTVGVMQDMGCRDADDNNQTHIIARYTANHNYSRINSSILGDVGGILDSRRMLINVRLNANDIRIYQNAVNILSQVRAVGGLPNADMYILGYNNNGVLNDPSNREYSVGFAGSSMTQTNVTNFDNRLVTFLTAIGAAV